MLTIAYYFLQVVLCSGMLMGYYWIVLRNKRFHQYNRFYLLAAALLSWIVPLIKITWSKPVAIEEGPGVMYLLSAVASNNSQIESSITQRAFLWSWDVIVPVFYCTVSAVLLFAMVKAFIRLYRLLKAHSCKNVGDVFLILTQAKGTPFSFFRYIFWNEEIDIRSEAGKQILQHELTHVQQRHSFDKIMVQLMLVIGWFNPFLWLLRKEMEMIHEFIADKKAVNNGDTAALAQMLLTAAYPQQKFALTHPFFFSPIKRRLLMLTNNKNPRFSYFRRLVVLPLLAIVIVLFAFRSAEKRVEGELSVASVVENYKDDITQVFLTPVTPPAEANFILLNGKQIAAETVNIDELRYGPHLLDLQEERRLSGNTQPIVLKTMGSDEIEEPLFVVSGRKMTARQFGELNLNPGTIQNVSVIRSVDAVNRYGAEASGGVVEIKLKDNTERIPLMLSYDEPRFSFPVISGVAEDSYNNIARNRKVYVKETIYQGEEKTKIIEEVHEVISSSDGSFSIKIGAGKPSNNSRKAGEVDLSKGPFFANTKIAVAPSAPAAWWVAEDNYIDKGFVALTLKDNKPLKFPPPPTQLEKYTMSIGPDGKSVLIRTVEPIDKNNFSFDLTISNEKTAETKGNTLSEVVVTGYGRADDANGRVAPKFPGGKEAWDRYISRNLNRDILKTNKAPNGKYTVDVSFIIGTDGSVTEVKALNDPGFGTAAEAERLILKSPKWTPATDDKGQPQMYRQKQSISFITGDEKPTGKLAFSDSSFKGTLSSITVSPTSDFVPMGTISGGVFSGTLRSQHSNPPAFVGGMQGWTKYLNRYLDKDIAAKNGGAPGKYTVVVRFTVASDGAVSNVAADNDPGFGTKNEAVRIIEKGPKWVAGTVNGQPISMRHSISLTFVVSPEKTTAAVKELLKKMPGVSISNEVVTLNNRPVDRIVIDGIPNRVENFRDNFQKLTGKIPGLTPERIERISIEKGEPETKRFVIDKAMEKKDVQDLLNKLPGVKVDKEGNIRMNEEKVTRVVIDSKAVTTR